MSNKPVNLIKQVIYF